MDKIREFLHDKIIDKIIFLKVEIIHFVHEERYEYDGIFEYFFIGSCMS